MTSDSIQKLIAEHLAPSLKEQGFKKNGTTWNCRVDQGVRVINLQCRAGAPDSEDVTLNLGFWIEAVWKVCWAKPTPSLIREEDCFPRYRIGRALGGFQDRTRDKWWKVPTAGCSLEMAEEIRDALFEKGLPPLLELRNGSDALALVRKGVPVRLPLEVIYLSILQFQNGEVNAAKSALENLSSDEHWGSRARGILERLHET